MIVIHQSTIHIVVFFVVLIASSGSSSDSGSSSGSSPFFPPSFFLLKDLATSFRTPATTPAPNPTVAPPTIFAVTVETPTAPALCANANILPAATDPITDCTAAAAEAARTPPEVNPAELRTNDDTTAPMVPIINTIPKC